MLDAMTLAKLITFKRRVSSFRALRCNTLQQRMIIFATYSLRDYTGKKDNDIQEACKLFSQIARVIESKQLGPTVRTQYMRTAFQVHMHTCIHITHTRTRTHDRECMHTLCAYILESLCKHCMHTSKVNVYAYTNTYAYTYTYTFTRVCAYFVSIHRKQMRTLYAKMHAHTRDRMQAARRNSANAKYAHGLPGTHTYVRTHARTRTREHTRARTYSHTHTYTHTLTHKHSHTHTNTHK